MFHSQIGCINGTDHICTNHVDDVQEEQRAVVDEWDLSAESGASAACGTHTK